MKINNMKFFLHILISQLDTDNLSNAFAKKNTRNTLAMKIEVMAVNGVHRSFLSSLKGEIKVQFPDKIYQQMKRGLLLDRRKIQLICDNIL